MSEQVNKESEKVKATEPQVQIRENSSILDLDRIIEALNRLDFKSAIELCSQALSDPSLKGEQAARFLYLRSIAYERTSQFSSSIQDSELAVFERDLSLSLSLSLYRTRAALAHLASSLVHFDQAQKIPVSCFTSTPQILESISFLELQAAALAITDLKKMEKKCLIKRVPVELLSKILSFCDSPSMTFAMASWKFWKVSALNSPELFSQFRMKGKVSNIFNGLKSFRRLSSNKLEVIEIELLEEPLSTYLVGTLSAEIKLSSSTLKWFSISMKHNSGSLALTVAQNATNLEVLKSINLSGGPTPTNVSVFQNPTVQTKAPFVSKKLQTLVWHAGSSDLDYDDTLLTFLRSAKEVEINSNRIQEQWVWRLLSSNSTLRRLSLGNLQGTMLTQTDLQGPGLFFLAPPLSHSLKQVKLVQLPSFWPRCTFPNLQTLEVTNLKHQILVPSQTSSLVELSLNKALDYTTSNEENNAAGLVKVLWGCDSLEVLKIKTDTKPASLKFFEYLLSALVPLSIQSLEQKSALGPDSINLIPPFILPRLRILQIGTEGDSTEPRRDDESFEMDVSKILDRLVTARKVAFEGGSLFDVILAAQGLGLNSFDLNLTPSIRDQQQQTVFQNHLSIQELKVFTKLKANLISKNRLIQNVEKVDLKGLEIV